MNPQETTDYLIKVLWQNISNTYNSVAAEFELTQSLGYMLINIHDEGTAVSTLANLLGVKTTSLSRMLNNMELSKLIVRKISKEDKRSVMVFLSPLGVEKRKIAKQVVKDFNKYLDEKISLKEREQLHQTLRKINKYTLSYKPKQDETNY